MVRPQIGAPLAGNPFRFRPPPGGDLRVVARQQHLRHGAALPAAGAGVVRILQQSLLETLLDQRAFIAQHARQQPHAGVDQRQRRRLAARQHEVAEADLLRPPRLEDPLVDALVAPAKRDQPRTGGEFARPRLIEAASARRQIDQRQPGRATDGGFDRRIDHVRAHHHAGTAAERCIVDGGVFIARERPDVHGFQAPQASGQCLAGERDGERPRKHLRKDGQHACRPRRRLDRRSSPVVLGLAASSPGSDATTRRPAARSTSGTAALLNGTSTDGAPSRSISRTGPAPIIVYRRDPTRRRAAVRADRTSARSPIRSA